MVARAGREPLEARHVTRAVEVQGDADDAEVADDLAVCLQLDVVDETLHRPGSIGEVVAQPFAVEPARHLRILLGTYGDDPCYVTQGSVIGDTRHHGDELVVRVLDVLVVLAVLVTGVRLVVQEGHDERVLEEEAERVRVSVHTAGARDQPIPKERPAARAIDQDVARLEHRDRVLGRQGRRGALHRMRVACIDQLADGALDRVERDEAARPIAQTLHQVRRDRLPERKARGELRGVEDGLHVVTVEMIGPIRLDRIRDEVGAEPDHAGTRVVATLLVEMHRDTAERLEQRRQEKADGSCAQDMHASLGT